MTPPQNGYPPNRRGSNFQAFTRTRDEVDPSLPGPNKTTHTKMDNTQNVGATPHVDWSFEGSPLIGWTWWDRVPLFDHPSVDLNSGVHSGKRRPLGLSPSWGLGVVKKRNPVGPHF